MDKNYEPEVIQENPFPGEAVQPILSSPQAVGVGNYSPNTTKEKTFPQKKTAVELLSTALNTRSRKILQEFELQQSGGIQVGNFQEGLTGDLRLTPNGITARDIAGLTTFAIDGTTGDAIFAGELRTGALITGSVEVIDGNISLYNGTLLQIFIGDDGT
jgi:hypothetical protein